MDIPLTEQGPADPDDEPVEGHKIESELPPDPSPLRAVEGPENATEEDTDAT